MMQINKYKIFNPKYEKWFRVLSSIFTQMEKALSDSNISIEINKIIKLNEGGLTCYLHVHNGTIQDINIIEKLIDELEFESKKIT